MKTKFKLVTGTLILFVFLGSCEKDEQETQEFSESAMLKTYNNGMIKSYSNEAVLAWNQALTFVDTKLPQPAEAKIYAMVTLAMHDALNNVVPKYETYALDNSTVDAKDISKKNISQIADAAVAQAAHDVLTTLFPLSAPTANALLSVSLDAIDNETYKQKGIEIGQNAASAILTKRQTDPSVGFTTYNEGTASGIHQANFLPWSVANPPVWPANAVYGANLSQIAPFGMQTSDQFRAGPPYAIGSPEYLADYEETRLLGCTSCNNRTAEQTEIGAFWVENICSSSNRIGRALSNQENLNGWETARLLALTQMAVMDGFISSFEAKYHYKYWRPITAIRAGDSDGNDATIGDATWGTSFITPPTPEYPSTHATCSGAAAEVLRLFFGTDNMPVTVQNPYNLPGVERTMINFSQMAHESAVSRIYIGYHFRNAVEQGDLAGNSLGKYIFDHNLREIGNNNH